MAGLCLSALWVVSLRGIASQDGVNSRVAHPVQTLKLRHFLMVLNIQKCLKSMRFLDNSGHASISFILK